MKKAAPFLAFVGAFSQLLIPLAIVVQGFRLAQIQPGGHPLETQDIATAMKSVSDMANESNLLVMDLFLGVGIALAALLLFILAITAGRYRQPWAFWFACIYGCCLIPLIPIGTPFGIIMLVYALSKKTEFLAPQPQGSIPAY
jgi:hypothetical protein